LSISLTRDEIDRASSEIAAVSWPEFHTVYGSAEDIPRHLMALLRGDAEAALAAAGELWAALAHQRVLVPDAALPALPFLLLALRRDEEGLEAEILDILWGLLQGSPFSPVPQGLADGAPAWFFALQRQLRDALRGFVPRTGSEDVETIMDGIREALATPFPTPVRASGE
jgi:hypothetical protein